MPTGLTTSQTVARNLTFHNITVSNLRGESFAIDQCTSFVSGVKGNCNSSKFAIMDINISNVTGTLSGSTVAKFQCSAAAPCSGITMTDSSYKTTSGSVATGYKCSNVKNAKGFTCTGGV